MQNKLNDEQKVNVLMSALEERYQSLRTIRERIQNICLWMLGILFGVSGWLIQSDIRLFTEEKTLFIIGLAILFAVLRFGYLSDLERGFKGQQRVVVRLERNLGLFNEGVFDDSNESVYPKSWEKAGSENGNGNFFNTTYRLLYVGFGFLAVVVILQGCLF